MSEGPGSAGAVGPGEEFERFGRTIRHYRMAISAGALALAWARQSDAAQGSTVIADREVSPLARLGRLWPTRPEDTLAFAVVLRPPLVPEQADATWLLAGLAVAEGAEEAAGRGTATWWPDSVVAPGDGAELASVKLEVQLGPGKVRSAVASVRMDLPALGLADADRDRLLEAVLGAFDRHCASLDEGPDAVAAAYEGRCALVGRRVKVRLLPKGETRGVVRSVDRSARLEVESATGMVQRIAIDTLRELTEA